MQQVRRAVIGTQRVAAFYIDLQLDDIAHFHLAGVNHQLVRVETAQRLRRIRYRGSQARQAGDATRIAHLSAAFAVEWRLVDEDGDFIKAESDCDEVTHSPDADDVFTCSKALANGLPMGAVLATDAVAAGCR